MVDKMMRVASRGRDGEAKAFRSDNSGSVITRTTNSIPLNGTTYINAGEKKEFGAYNLNHEAYPYALLDFFAGYSLNIYISYWDINGVTGSWEKGPWEKIFTTTSVKEKYNHLEIKLKTSTFSLMFENYGSINAKWTNRNRLVLSDHQILIGEKMDEIKSRSNNNKRELFESEDISTGRYSQSIALNYRDGESRRTADGYPFAKIYIPERFQMEVYYRGYVVSSSGVDTLQENILLYSSDERLGGIIELVVPMKYARYEYRVYNTGNLDGFMPEENYEVMYDYDPEISSKIEKTVNYLQKISKPKKMPSNLLSFKKIPIDMTRATKGHDGYFYVSDSSGNIKKYENVVTSTEPIENGINFYESVGLVQSDGTKLTTLIYIPNGITYFATVDGKATIYHAPDISTTPILVYQSDEANTAFNTNFGIDSYANGTSFTGRTKLIVAAEYGMGKQKRNLVISKDGGATFEVKKQTQNTTPDLEFNSHWHDVSIDVYHGKIWASEGDGAGNAGIHYTEDFGDTWTTIPGTEQPTAIIPFPDKVVFGRDGNLVGLDYVEYPNLISDSFTKPKPLQEFINAQAASYYANSPVVSGGEAYMTFTLYDSIDEHAIVVGTGDFGNSWTGLAMADTNISNFWGIDENYIYAFDKWYGYGIYAERPKWN